MKPLLIFLLLATSIPVISQISFFKQLNDVEEGSYPANFTEFKGEVYFTVGKSTTGNLWKTDGTEIGTIPVSDKFLYFNSSQGSVTPLLNSKNLFVCNDKLYFRVINNENSAIEVWYTDGLAIIKTNFYNVPQFCKNNEPIEEINTTSFIKNVQLSNSIIKFENKYVAQYQRNILDIIKYENAQTGNQIIGSIDSLSYGIGGSDIYSSTSLRIEDNAYFFIPKKIELSLGIYVNRIELWKTDGNIVVKVKNLIDLSPNNFDFNILSLADFNGKLIFLFNKTDLWISDGTEGGTSQIGNTTGLYRDWTNKTFGILSNKFLFAKTENGDNELWVSDGTSGGAQLLKNINLNGSSNPSRFEKIGDKIFFKTSNNELWQSDGTETGTIFLMNIEKPSNETFPIIKDSFFQKSDGTIYFSNYSADIGYELWKSDGTIAGMQIIKNIATYKANSPYYDTKVKLGSTWYFNGADSKGTELWKTDGTPGGTLMVKDLNPGFENTIINELVATNNLLFFIGIQNNNNFLFRSDGTNEGTYKIPIPKIHADVNKEAYKLTVVENRLFFLDNGNNLWVSDGSLLGTYKVENESFFHGSPQILVGCGNKCIISSGRLFTSDGVVGNTQEIFDLNNPNRPIYSTCFTAFKGKTYFLGATSNLTPYNNRCLFETDGTALGTKIIKTFNNDDLFLDNTIIFLEKSDEKLFFRTNYVRVGNNASFDLWTSDGSEEGTKPLKRIDFKAFSKFNFYSVENKLIINIYQLLFPSIGQSFNTDGSIENTFKFLDFENSAVLRNFQKMNQKYYFSQYKSDLGLELWETDFSISGTKLAAEIRPGQPSSGISSLMNFDDKILMSGTDGTGMALWQYIDNSQIKSIKSGSWDDPTTWNTGVVPAISSNVSIEVGHTVSIPAAINANLFTIIIKTGGILEIGNGSGLNLNGQN